VRNWQDLDRGLVEVQRVLRRDGRFVVLEFSTPRAPLMASAYFFYFRRVLPRLATWISRDRTGAYRYLPASVASFVDEEGMKASLRSAGFARIETRRLTLGIVTVFVNNAMGMGMVPVVGASGAIYGLLLAFAAFFPDARIFVFGVLPMRAPIAVAAFAGIAIVSQLVNPRSGTAHLAHLAGIAFGYLYLVVRYGINPITVFFRRR
jgi:hypothetical protein